MGYVCGNGKNVESSVEHLKVTPQNTKRTPMRRAYTPHSQPSIPTEEGTDTHTHQQTRVQTDDNKHTPHTHNYTHAQAHAHAAIFGHCRPFGWKLWFQVLPASQKLVENGAGGQKEKAKWPFGGQMGPFEPFLAIPMKKIWMKKKAKKKLSDPFFQFGKCVHFDLKRSPGKIISFWNHCEDKCTLHSKG